MIDCCICLDISIKYTQVPNSSKCEHPVCVDCFKQLLEKECYENGKKIPCPLCRAEIESPEIEISSAIEQVENVTYGCIYDPAIHTCDEIIFFDEDIIFINYEYDEVEKTSRRNQVRKFNYMNRIIPKNRNRRSMMTALGSKRKY
jgi:hypothetical protein